MDAVFGFIWGLIQFAIFVAILVAAIAAWGYNSLRALSESIRESWSNISVVGKKQISLINQLIDVVKGYQESENLVMLKVSDDSTAQNIAQMHQQSGMVLSTVSGIAQKFPELKANQQYLRLIDSIQSCEAQLESARQKYNADVKIYNTRRSSMPHVFYANMLGFKTAPYLEFDGGDQMMDMGTLKSFASDDGERLNALLGQAGSKLMETGGKALDSGKALASAAQEKIKQLQDNKSISGSDDSAAGSQNDQPPSLPPSPDQK